MIMERNIYTDTEKRISTAELWAILKECMEVGYINEYPAHRIMDKVKKI